MSIYENLWFTKVNLDINIKLGMLKKGLNPKKVYNFTIEDFLRQGLTIREYNAFEKAKNHSYLENLIIQLEKEEIRFVFITDKDYPNPLREIYKPPIGIFIKGNIIDLENSIAIVGARRASLYGKTIAKSFGKYISNKGITIVSGLALGIDAFAHIGALEGSRYTVGVIGSGHNHIYPKTNRELYTKVLEKGCIISEYFPEDKPLKHRFPERNRIISGLTKGCVIVEAGEKSGSLITANFALEQGREVYVVPGNINSPNSIGCNSLIKEGAKIVTNINDILEDFSICENKKENYKERLNTDETKVVSCLEKGDKSFEDIHVELKIEVNKLMPILSKLECLNIIKRLYGNYYSIYQT